jgi:predicted AAA+ superfamily ATPase
VKSQPDSYRVRVVDTALDELVTQLPAIAIEGPKAVGKTRTAMERAATVHRLDDPAEYEIARSDPARLLEGTAPVLIDEWQRLPEVWDLVRRAVDDGAPPGNFLMTGSAIPASLPAHSGAGRVATVRMRPMTLTERGFKPSVSTLELIGGQRPEIVGTTDLGLVEYVDEILASGFPAIRTLSGRALRIQLDAYLDRVIERDIPDDAGTSIRNPAALRRWMAAYAAASSTTTTFEKIRDAASPGQEKKPAKQTSQGYRDALSRVWILDEVSAWMPTSSHLRQLGSAPKHQIADPALAARLLGLDATALLNREVVGPTVPRDGTFVGALFESLATLCVRSYAEAAEARTGHLRTARGRQEIDLIVERPDGKVVAFEAKLARTVSDDDVRHLNWLGERLGDRLLDRVVLSTGPAAYRRPDGIAVVPLALLGP